MLFVQQIIERLNQYWQDQGCTVLLPYDLEKGAGTFHPATFLRSLGPEPFSVAYVEPSRRPTDGRFGQNPNRFYRFHQYQVILKPCPSNCQELYLKSLEALGMDLLEHDIRFVHDDWESPTLGAAGLGWEVWCDGMEITQFTYFQQVGSLPCESISCELTYGIERLAMYLQNKNSALDVQWSDTLTFGDLYLQSEQEFSQYHFHEANASFWQRHFDDYEEHAKNLISKNLPLAGYDFVLKASHAFNSLDAMGAISTTQRASYIAKIRDLAHLVAKEYLESRQTLGFPLGQITTPQPIEAPETKTVHSASDFLFEIGSEELPSGYVEIGLQSLHRQMKELLDKNRLAYDQIQLFATPRRLAILVTNLAPNSPEETKRKKGPAVKAAFNPEPTPAFIGFLRSIGKEPISLEQLQSDPSFSIEKIQNEDYIFAHTVQQSVSTTQILKESLPKIIHGISFPKKMRWNSYGVEYARPISWLLALFGSEPVHFTFGDLISDRVTRGHRFLSPKPISLETASSYEATLEKSFVIPDITKRKEKITSLLQEKTSSSDLTVENQNSIIKEVVHLVEYPFLAEGSFDAEFLELPKELLFCEMISHQKVFPISEKNQIANRFFIITNNEPTEKIIEGNERVISSRLHDGEFLFKEDLKVSLETFSEKLKEMVFVEQLGSMYDKTTRIYNNASFLEPYVKTGSTHIETAARLSKADLASTLVFEFPELQGIVGARYAQAANLSKEICLSIEEHWKPLSEGGDLPTSPLGVLLSLADKLDSLTCLFAIGKQPSSSSDPFALRRASIGISRLLFDHKIHLPLFPLLKKITAQLPCDNPDEVAESVFAYIYKRAQGILSKLFTSSNLNYITLSKEGDLYDYSLRIAAVDKIAQSSDFEVLLEVLKRTHNLTKNAITTSEDLNVQPALFESDYEKKLFTSYTHIRNQIESHIKNKLYYEALVELTSFQKPLYDFFENVRVLADNADIQKNRLSLLKKIASLSTSLINPSKIS